MKTLLFIAVFAGALGVSSVARAEAFDISGWVSAVPYAKAKVQGSGDEYKFRGTGLGISLLVPYKEDTWVGMFYNQDFLSNTYTDDDAEETMKTEDYGMLASLISPKYSMQMQAGIGFTQAEIRQEAPNVIKDKATGYMFKFSFQNGIWGPSSHHFFLRAEVDYRGFAGGKNVADESEKLLPFTQITLPICLGALVRF